MWCPEQYPNLNLAFGCFCIAFCCIITPEENVMDGGLQQAEMQLHVAAYLRSCWCGGKEY